MKHFCKKNILSVTPTAVKSKALFPFYYRTKIPQRRNKSKEKGRAIKSDKFIDPHKYFDT